MASFATVADLELATKRPPYAGADILWVTELLAQASAHLRTVLGWQVFPQSTASYRTVLRACEHYTLPSQPSQLVSVVIDGASVETHEYDGGFMPTQGGLATVTFTAGYATAPVSLKSWTIVLATQVIDTITKLGLLSSGGLSSVAIDDFKMVWAQSEDSSSGYGIPKSVADRLRAEFTMGGAVVTGR